MAQIHYTTPDGDTYRTDATGAHVPSVGDTVCLPTGNGSPDGEWLVTGREYYPGTGDVLVSLQDPREPRDPCPPPTTMVEDLIEEVDATNLRRTAMLVDGLADALQAADDTDDAPKGVVDRLDSAFAELTHLYDSTGMIEERMHFERLLGALREHVERGEPAKVPPPDERWPQRWLKVHVTRDRTYPRAYEAIQQIDVRYRNELECDALEMLDGAMRYGGASLERIALTLQNWSRERFETLARCGVSDARVRSHWRFQAQWFATVPEGPDPDPNAAAKVREGLTKVRADVRRSVEAMVPDLVARGVLAIARDEHGSAILFEPGQCYTNVMRSLVGMQVRAMDVRGTVDGCVCGVTEHDVAVEPTDANGMVTGPTITFDATRTTFYVL